MNKIIKLGAIALAAGGVIAGLTACESDSHVVSDNISRDAEQFKIQRQIVFYNGITDKYMLTIVGRCSVDDAGDALPGKSLAVTCQIGPGQYTKDYLGLSDNVTYLTHQLQASNEDPYRHEVIFKPESIIPDISVHTSRGDLGGTGSSDGGVPIAPATPAPVTTPSK